MKSKRKWVGYIVQIVLQESKAVSWIHGYKPNRAAHG